MVVICLVVLDWMGSVLTDDLWSFQPMEIYVDDEAKLTLHGLVQVRLWIFYSRLNLFNGISNIDLWQHYIKLTELEKNRKLNDLLDALDFNQVVIFVKSVSRAAELNKLLVECNFPSICIHSGMSQEERYAFAPSTYWSPFMLVSSTSDYGTWTVVLQSWMQIVLFGFVVFAFT